jgi:hypothetical protein
MDCAAGNCSGDRQGETVPRAVWTAGTAQQRPNLVRIKFRFSSRMRAAIAGLGKPEEFAQGHRLEKRCGGGITLRDTGRELSATEARAIEQRIECTLRKPPALSFECRLHRTARA